MISPDLYDPKLNRTYAELASHYSMLIDPARARKPKDNALAENFFSILKVERVYRTTYRTREKAELDIFRYIDGWYNPHRIQRELGWLSPDEYEDVGVLPPPGLRHPGFTCRRQITDPPRNRGNPYKNKASNTNRNRLCPFMVG